MPAHARSVLSPFVVLAGLAGLANGFWRMECRARSGLARIDPLMNYGTVGTHAHAVHGSSGFSETSEYADLMAGDCTSCSVSQDKSAYWTPALYFQYADTGEFELVEQVGGMLAYYLLYTNTGNTSLSAFPEGFQMIAGDTNRRNFTGPVPDPPKSDWTASETTQESLAEKAIGFNCLNYDKAAEGSLYRHFMPDKAYLDANCTDGLRLELMFPSCWNGVDLDSANHKDHVAYPNEVMTGDCPEGFETRLVSLFYETIWNTYAFYGVDGQFVISNGDPTGYGYHGDFIMGWDGAFLQEAVDTCTNSSGEIEDCQIFDIQPASTYDACNFTVPDALVSEDVVGPMATLPGNVAIQSGPQPAVETSTAGSTDNNPTATGSAVPTLGYSSGQSVSSGGTYTPGAVFIQSSTPTVAPSPSTTPETSSSTAFAAAAAVMTSYDVSSATPSPSSSFSSVYTPSSSSVYTPSSSSVDTPPSSTITPTPSTSSVPSTTYFSTQYITSGSEVDEILWVVETEYVTATEIETVTAGASPSQVARGVKARGAGSAPAKVVGGDKEKKSARGRDVLEHVHRHAQRRSFQERRLKK